LSVGLLFLRADSPAEVYTTLFLFGLCLSGVFPTVMAEVNSRRPGRSGRVTGVLSVAASAGAAAIQPIMGLVAEGLGLQWAMALPALLIAGAGVAFWPVGRPTTRLERSA
jgi:fucose permease